MDSTRENFISMMQGRTRKFAVEIIKFCNALSPSISSKNISYQLIKSSTSVGANYRAVCRSRSNAEFYSKLSITVEEADESLYWLEIINDLNISNNKIELKRLIEEAEQILKILAKARKSARN